MIVDFWTGLRRRVRTLGRRPGFTVLAVSTLALGIGANTALFSVLHAVLIAPLPYANPDRLVAVFLADPEAGEFRLATSPLYYFHWKEDSERLDQLTAAHPWSPTLAGKSNPDKLDGLRASAGLFQLLGQRAAIGGTFDPDRIASGEARVIVLSHALWQRKFGSDPEIVGQTLTLNGEPYEVIGVTPPGFRFPPFWATNAEFWTPLVIPPEDRQRNARFIRVFARLREGATVEQAQSELNQLTAAVAARFSLKGRRDTVSIEPLHEPVVSEVRPALFVLFAAVGVVLLTACANVANLLLAAALQRKKEMALRMALGAGRGRLVIQLLGESTVLALAGGIAGVAFAWCLLQGLLALSPPELPRFEEVTLSLEALGFTLGLSLVAGLLFGLAPALHTTRLRLSQSLRQGHSRTRTDSGSSSRLLVIGEVSLALLVVVAAGLLLRSFQELQGADLGFATENRITMSIGLDGSAFEPATRQLQFVEELIPRVEALPGVLKVGLINHLHLGGDLWSSSVRIEGAETPPAERPNASMRTVDPGFFQAMGIPLLQGREFNDGDRPESMPVVIVNQKLAAELGNAEAAIGRRIRQFDEGPWTTVIGVVADARQWDVTDPVKPEVYYPYSQNPVSWWATMSLVAHTSVPPRTVVDGIREAVWSLSRNLPVTRVRTMDEIFAGSIARQRFSMLLLTLFSLLALGLSATGLYGVLSSAVSRRTHEIGVRMALGARTRNVVRMIMAQGMKLVAVGLGLGLGLVLALSRLLAGRLYRVSPNDPWALLGGVLVLTLVGALACYRPARRATRVDPVEALRHE